MGFLEVAMGENVADVADAKPFVGRAGDNGDVLETGEAEFAGVGGAGAGGAGVRIVR